MMRELLAHGADVNARSNQEEWERQVTSEPRDKWLPPGGLTPLLFAAREGCLACLPVLIEAGADFNATTPDGISAVVARAHQRSLRRRRRARRSGHRPESRRLHGPNGALYAAIDFNTMPKSNRPAPKVIENRLTGARRRAHAARARRRRRTRCSRRLPPYRAKLDRGNDGMLGARHDAVPARRQSRRPAGDAAAARARRGPDACADAQRHQPADGRRGARHGRAGHDGPARRRRSRPSRRSSCCSTAASTSTPSHATAKRPCTARRMQGYDDVISSSRRRAPSSIRRTRTASRRSTWRSARPGGFGFTGNEGVVREGTAAALARAA